MATLPPAAVFRVKSASGMVKTTSLSVLLVASMSTTTPSMMTLFVVTPVSPLALMVTLAPAGILYSTPLLTPALVTSLPVSGLPLASPVYTATPAVVIRPPFRVRVLASPVSSSPMTPLITALPRTLTIRSSPFRSLTMFFPGSTSSLKFFSAISVSTTVMVSPVLTVKRLPPRMATPLISTFLAS